MTRASALAPFGVRSFRFQWPADLATSWAFEMEALILGWYVLTATGSVQQLVVFGAAIAIMAAFGVFFQSTRMGKWMQATADNMRAAARYCMEHPRWRLSVQTHKWIGIP